MSPVRRLFSRLPSSAFTLIELLIVVAIIAILAAIAVPNFLEAQTRSKVARTVADMRSLTTAVETYYTDHNKYPPSIDPQTGATFVPRIRQFRFVTTPIAYISSAFPDVFNTNERAPSGFSEGQQRVLIFWGNDILVDYRGTNLRPRSAQIFREFPEVSDGTNIRDDSLWAMISFSPDQDFDVLDNGWPSPIQQYDPTNGTVSDGDVVRLRQ